MIYLLLSIVSSTLISVFMRNSEKYIKNNIAMFLVNYAVCSCLARAFMGDQKLFVDETGIGFAVMIGFITAIAAIIVVNGYTSNHKKNVDSGRSWLVILLLIGGFTDSLANIYNERGTAELKNHYLFFTFAAACLLCITIMIVKKQTLTLMDTIWGILVGIPNYFASRCLLFSLEELPAIVVYPVYNVATILIISVIGILIFKEQLEIRKRWGLALIIASLVLINL